MIRKFLLVLMGCVLISGTAWARPGDPDAGQQKSQTCQACHGADGNSPTPNFPKLAGQYQTYLLRALQEYKSGARKNAIMAGMVAPLSDEDMQDLAAYFSSQQGLSTPPRKY